MVRNRRVFTAAAVAAVFAVGAAVVSAQAPRAGRPRLGAGGLGGGLALRALNLTEAQREQVRQLTERNREQAGPTLERLRSAREAQRQAIEALPPNEGQIRAAAQAVAEVEADLAVQRARLQADIYALLTTDQQAQLQKMRAQREARLKERQQRLQRRLEQRRRV
jgi:Spy/CpxP family protein refolding chaperone